MVVDARPCVLGDGFEGEEGGMEEGGGGSGEGGG